MLVSILHRITGSALTFAGLALLTWWLLAIAERRRRPMTSSSPSPTHPLGLVVLVGLTWAFWQHFFRVRHLFLDMGAGYELKINNCSGADHRRCPAGDRRAWFVLMGAWTDERGQERDAAG